MNFAKTLTDWYVENRRDLPWRGVSDPYRIWLSEIILQQTRVNQGKPYYERFLERFPSVTALADASEDEVLKLWQGLGYYSRARNLHRAAKTVVEKYGGVFPRSYEAVRALPGVGDYTAAAVVSFAYGLPYPVIDGNVIRFISRYDGVFEEAGSPSCRKRITELLKGRMDEGWADVGRGDEGRGCRANGGRGCRTGERRAGEGQIVGGRVSERQMCRAGERRVSEGQVAIFNQGLMEMGALVCLPTKPLCDRCPFADGCYAYRHGVADSLPVKRVKKELVPVHLHYLYLEEHGFVWVHKRGYNDLWRGMYELPLMEAVSADRVRESSADRVCESSADRVCESSADLVFMQERQQALSHRLVRFYFYRVKPGSATADRIKNDKNFQKTAKKMISQLAVPKGIENFFRDFKIF